MRPFALLLALATSVSLVAEQPAKKAAASDQTTAAVETPAPDTVTAMPKTKPATTGAAAPPTTAKAATAGKDLRPVQDSPLVAAAKRSASKKKDKKVITNETLKEMNQGHITTTKMQRPIVIPAEPQKTAEEEARERSAERRKQEAEAEARSAIGKERQQATEQREAAARAEGDDWMEEDGSGGRPPKPKPSATTSTQP